MWSDTLTSKEAEFTRHALDALRSVAWVKPLLTLVQRAGGLQSKNKPLLFEVRIALELHQAGVTASYEHSAGIGDSTVDFGVSGPSEWLIEIVSIGASDAVKRATRQIGFIYEQELSTNAPDPARSEEAEMITVEQKIGEKVLARGRPTKFPVPHGSTHLILTDMRGYLDDGGDALDYVQMAYGARGLSPNHAWATHFWNTEPGKSGPIRGLFERGNPLKAAPLIQERIHFLGFIREREYREGEIGDTTCIYANPRLFSSQGEVNKALSCYPLKRRKNPPRSG